MRKIWLILVILSSLLPALGKPIKIVEDTLSSSTKSKDYALLLNYADITTQNFLEYSYRGYHLSAIYLTIDSLQNTFAQKNSLLESAAQKKIHINVYYPEEAEFSSEAIREFIDEVQQFNIDHPETVIQSIVLANFKGNVSPNVFLDILETTRLYISQNKYDLVLGGGFYDSSQLEITEELVNLCIKMLTYVRYLIMPNPSPALQAYAQELNTSILEPVNVSEHSEKKVLQALQDFYRKKPQTMPLLFIQDN